MEAITRSLYIPDVKYRVEGNQGKQPMITASLFAGKQADEYTV